MPTAAKTHKTLQSGIIFPFLCEVVFVWREDVDNIYIGVSTYFCCKDTQYLLSTVTYLFPLWLAVDVGCYVELSTIQDVTVPLQYISIQRMLMLRDINR